MNTATDILPEKHSGDSLHWDGFALWCPVCRKQKPENPDDLNDVVLMRMDWRKAGRPERKTINEPVGQSPMCLACYHAIAFEWAAKAPRFDAKGNRL